MSLPPGFPGEHGAHDHDNHGLKVLGGDIVPFLVLGPVSRSSYIFLALLDYFNLLFLFKKVTLWLNKFQKLKSFVFEYLHFFIDIHFLETVLG